MLLDDVLARFVKRSPLAVMAQLGLETVLDPAWVDAIFEEHRDRQYQRELFFSTTVNIMSLVALGLRPSVNAAVKARTDVNVSLTALYNKINRTEPALGRALVTGSFERLSALAAELKGPERPRVLPGFRIRIVDGNNLAPTDKRLKVLRSYKGPALPGRSLVVYDPDLGLVTDVVPCEDAHTAERALMPALEEISGPGDLWIADRNFSTSTLLSAWLRGKAAFVVREHGLSPNPAERGEMREIGRIEVGLVLEQEVELRTAGGPVRLRRIELRLDVPTESGETTIRILSNLPAEHTAPAIADLYRRRWTVEGMFQQLEALLHSEVSTLGYPRAALFSFCVALMAYNLLSVLQTALERQQKLQPAPPVDLSMYYIAEEIRLIHTGMMIAVPEAAWSALRSSSSKDLAALLLEIAAVLVQRERDGGLG